MTPTQRAAMEQALKALKPIAAGNINSVISDAAYAAATSLIAALAEPAPVQETTCKQPLQVHRKPTGWMAHKNQYAVPVLFDPYTGEPRDVRDVQSDPQGVLIVPPGKVEVLAAQQPAPPAEVPMLTSEDRTAVVMHAERIYAEDSNGSWRNAIMSATEQAVRQKAGLQ